MLEDLVYLTMHYINGPVGQINPSWSNLENEHTDEDLSIDWTEEQGDQNHPETTKLETSESESLDLEEEDMADENIKNNHNDNQQPWLLRDSLAILGRKHHLPKHWEKLFLRFNLDSKESAKDHIQKFMLASRLMSIQAEDVVCSLFPYTFEGKSSTWYFCLPESLITSWNHFQTTFLD